MSLLCIAAASGVLSLAATNFTLSWTHSVALTRWEEIWEVSDQGLRPTEAMIQGAGAGMELPETAWRVEGGWRYKVALPFQREIFLGASGATRDAWELCANGHCHNLGETAGAPIKLWTAKDCHSPS